MDHKVRLSLSGLGIFVWGGIGHSLADVGAFGDGLRSPDSPTFVLYAEEHQSSRDAMLHQAIVASRPMALARPITLE